MPEDDTETPKSQQKMLTTACLVGLCSFIVGFAVNRVLSSDGFVSQTLLNAITRRDFDYCDRSWRDLAEEYATSHDVAVRKVDSSQIDTFLK